MNSYVYFSMPTGFFIWGYMYHFTFIFGGTSKFLGVQSLTLHLGVQRKLTAFSPGKGYGLLAISAISF
jgi:hypothetical protein